MQSRWNDAEAAHNRVSAGPDPADVDLADRVYTSRLIGGDPDLVLHGGGNTSVKTVRLWPDGSRRATLHVKGSGWDLATIEPEGLPALDLEALQSARDLPRMSDEQMVTFLRANLMDPAAPNPSLETLLHAFLPAKFVDHSHASAVLALANQPDAAQIGSDIYGKRLAIVDYVMPGYDLSIEAARIYDSNPDCEGLWLVNHGLFTFGETAQQSYQRMIEFAAMAEGYLSDQGAALDPEPGADCALPERDRDFGQRLQQAMNKRGHGWATAVLDFRTSELIRAILDQPEYVQALQRGTVTPDHVIRLKPFPLVLRRNATMADIDAALSDFATRYRQYFDQGAARTAESKIMLDPLPRLVLVPGLGLFGIGKSAGDARIVADLAMQMVRVVSAAERYGIFAPLHPLRLFEMEYWSLEQAKLRKS
ncbi:class II aldolase/adducin family protein [Pseudotabrizicola alkalilacus]|uniref:Class II aldolase n=1 Tax=Pseudotabrizicola alkalilacus TaxID=2305252 RepID=A0A411Z4W3_9RHOB|nr:class II aldolase/adducin family protein [Pseudotabrizicola alkalilacus]RGP38094.1 class II aldolase [Pseudotabrizicola alkalilacus]